MNRIEKLLFAIILVILGLIAITALDIYLKAPTDCIQNGYVEDGVYVPACRDNPDCL